MDIDTDEDDDAVLDVPIFGAKARRFTSELRKAGLKVSARASSVSAARSVRAAVRAGASVRSVKHRKNAIRRMVSRRVSVLDRKTG